MFAKITLFLCLAALATAVPVPQYIQSPLGLGLGGIAGIGGIGGLGGIGLGHSAVGYGPGIGYGPSVGYAPSVAYASPAIPALSSYGAVPRILAPAPVLHKTLITPPIVKTISPIDPNPQYSYNYGVSDPHTGDNKQAEETLVNGVVHGSYSLTEPDGTIRKVTYTADKINGFNAVVQRLGVAHHTAPIHKVITPAVHAVAPALHTSSILSPAYAAGYSPYH